jgi:hypothetical protein
MLASAFQSMATDRFVDPSLSAGNGTTLFTTSASAVAASVNGDRVLILPGTYNEPALTIDKSLTIMGQIEASIVNFNANITIAGFAGMKLQLLGFNLGIYSITGNAVTSGVVTNRAVVNIIKCSMASLGLDQNYYELNSISNKLTGNLVIRYGNVVLSNIANIYINDEPGANLAGKILIANDTVTGRVNFTNDDYNLCLYNNLLTNLYIWQWNNSTSTTNKILNNDFVSGAYIFIPYSGVPAYNFDFSNNQFLGSVTYYAGGDFNVSPGNCVGQSSNYPYYDYGTNAEACNPWSQTGSSFPNPSVTGFFKWTYNGIDLPCAIPSAAQPLVLTKVTGATGTTNTGNPAHEYYDIDLTVNDRGRTGGTYSISNFNPTINPSNGKALIFDLDIPSDLFPGQSVNVKAKGYQKN